MKTIQISESNARRLYKEAPPEFKMILEDTFGKDFFSEDPADIDYVWGLFEDGHIISTYVSGSMNSGFTHYQHISKPKLPIY